jgi:hypothetical protein
MFSRRLCTYPTTTALGGVGHRRRRGVQEVVVEGLLCDLYYDTPYRLFLGHGERKRKGGKGQRRKKQNHARLKLLKSSAAPRR